MSTKRAHKTMDQALTVCERIGDHKLAEALAKRERRAAERLAEIQSLVTEEMETWRQLQLLCRAHQLLAQYAEATGLGIQARRDGRLDSAAHWTQAQQRARRLAWQACKRADEAVWIPEAHGAQQPL